MSENNRIEFKKQLTDLFEKEVVAFLNYLGGGVIYIGINDEGKIVGVEDSDKLQLQIKDRIKNNISPSCMGLFDVVEEYREEKPIIKVIVASGQERPYYIKKYGMSSKGAFMRNGSASEPMTTKMIEELFAKRTRKSIATIKAPKQELKFEQLRIYYDVLGKTLNEDKVFNYVGYMLADNNTVSIKVAKYNGIDRVDLVQSNEYGFAL